MARRYIRIGGHVKRLFYDDGDGSAIETDGEVIASNFSSGGTSGFTGSLTAVTALQAGGAGPVGFQYKTRTITYSTGLVTNVSAESAWNDV